MLTCASPTLPGQEAEPAEEGGRGASEDGASRDSRCQAQQFGGAVGKGSRLATRLAVGTSKACRSESAGASQVCMKRHLGRSE